MSPLSRKIRLGRVAKGIAACVVISAAVLGLTVRWVVGGGMQEVPPDDLACAGSSPLRPVVRAGFLWEQHRHWLESVDSALTPERTYVVINQRTNQYGRWLAEDVEGWRVRFGVPTRYALFLNRNWMEDPWVVCLTWEWSNQSAPLTDGRLDATGAMATVVGITSPRL